MKVVSVRDSRDEGAALIISEAAWFVVLVDWCVGRYNPHWGFDFRVWRAVLNWCYRRKRELVRVPVSHSCEVIEKLWGSESHCYHAISTDREVVEAFAVAMDVLLRMKAKRAALVAREAEGYTDD